MTRFLWVILLASLLWAMQANADCTSPTGVAGVLQFNSPNMQYCAGTVWVTANVSNSGTACGSPGVTQFSTELLFCSAATNTWHYMGNTGVSYGACSAGQAGYFYYGTPANTNYWYCNGSVWRRMGP